MHSPRRSASALTRPRPISSASQPGKSPADQVAGRGRRDPARDQRQRAPPSCPARAAARAHRVLVIQQAQEILAALADDDAAALLRRVGIEPVEFAGDLALQVAGIGRDPHRALVLLGPQAGRRDIAEGLADPGAGLGQHRAAACRAARAARRRRRPRRRNRPAAAAPRRRRRAARRAARASSSGETGSLPGGGGGARSCHSGRFCQARSPAARRDRCRVGRRQSREHRRTPAPAGVLGDLGEGADIRVGRRPASCCSSARAA